MQNTLQAGQGDVGATKALIRSIIQHGQSSTTADMAVGEIAYLGDGLFHAKNASGTFALADDAEVSALEALLGVEANASGKGLVRYLVTQATDPATVAGEVALYSKVVGSSLEVFARYPSNGTIVQLTSGGALNVPSDTGAKLMSELASGPATAPDQGAVYTKDVGGVTEAFYRYPNSGAELQLTSGGHLKTSSGAPIPLADMSPDPDYPADVAQLVATGYGAVYAASMADGSDSGITGLVTLPDSTKAYQLVLKTKQASALTGRYVALTVQMKAIAAGEDPMDASWDVNTTQSIACRNDTGLLVVEHASFRFPAASMHSDNQLVRVRILRDGDGTSGTDDHTGACYLVDAFFKEAE